MAKNIEEYTNNSYKGLTVEQANLINRSFPLHSEYFDAMKFLVQNYTFAPSEYKQVTDQQQLAYKRTAMLVKHLNDKDEITKNTFLSVAYEVAEKACGTKNLPSIYFSLTYFYNHAILATQEDKGLKEFDERKKAGDINDDVRKFISDIVLCYKQNMLLKNDLENKRINQEDNISYIERMAFEKGMEHLIYKSEIEKFIEENYFFQRNENNQVKFEQFRLIRKMAALIDYMVTNDCINTFGLIKAEHEVYHLEMDMKQSSSVEKDLLYFYNKSIPMEYKNHIASYKFRFKEETSVTPKVRNKVIILAEKYQQKQAGIQKRK